MLCSEGKLYPKIIIENPYGKSTKDTKDTIEIDSIPSLIDDILDHIHTINMNFTSPSYQFSSILTAINWCVNNGFVESVRKRVDSVSCKIFVENVIKDNPVDHNEHSYSSNYNSIMNQVSGHFKRLKRMKQVVTNLSSNNICSNDLINIIDKEIVKFRNKVSVEHLREIEPEFFVSNNTVQNGNKNVNLPMDLDLDTCQ